MPQRSYDATGVFGRLEEVYGQTYVWQNIPFVLKAPNDAAGFTQAGANDYGFLRVWAPGILRLGSTAKWNQRLPFYFTPGAVSIPERPITADTSPTLTRDMSVDHFVVNSVANRPLVFVSITAGHVAVAGDETDAPGGGIFCLAGKCVCPKGTSGTVPSSKRVSKVHIAASMGVADAAKAGFDVRFASLDEYCTKKGRRPRRGTPAQPTGNRGGDGSDAGSPGGDGPGPGQSNGDPHLITLDGLHYDFQAAGEFVLVRSDTGDLEVQARQEPVGTSRSVTMNTQFGSGWTATGSTSPPPTTGPWPYCWTAPL